MDESKPNEEGKEHSGIGAKRIPVATEGSTNTDSKSVVSGSCRDLRPFNTNNIDMSTKFSKIQSTENL